MLGAISAAHLGWPIFLAEFASRGSYFLDVGRYVGLVRFLKNLTIQNRDYTCTFTSVHTVAAEMVVAVAEIRLATNDSEICFC